MEKIKKENSGEGKSLSTTVAQENPIVNFNAESLLSQALQNNVPVETVERLVALAKDMQAVYAKQQFVKAMAAFQAECPTIVKTKEVKTDSGVIAYRYAPLESIVEQVKVPLQKNGFSYSSNMELIENGTTKVRASIKVTHIAGHSEVTEMTVALGNKTRVMSDSQVIAAAQTFAKRYAFQNALGIMTGDEDNDGQDIPAGAKKPAEAPKEAPKPIEKPIDHYTPLSARISECISLQSLDLIANEVVAAYKNGKISDKDLSFLVAAGKKKREQLTPPKTSGEKAFEAGLAKAGKTKESIKS